MVLKVVRIRFWYEPDCSSNVRKKFKKKAKYKFRKGFYEFISKNYSNTFGVPYDYGSVMHYSLYYFTNNREKTMKPFDTLYDMTPGPKSMSYANIKMLNIYYCENICKKNYIGPLCKIITPPSYKYIQLQFVVKNIPTKFEFYETNGCTFHFLANYNNRI
uniref:Astacin domain-containing protein n=1 Tax=Strongyloides ratti TaxID=34506 RepID=A0A7I5UC63_STRRB